MDDHIPSNMLSSNRIGHDTAGCLTLTEISITMKATYEWQSAKSQNQGKVKRIT